MVRDASQRAHAPICVNRIYSILSRFDTRLLPKAFDGQQTFQIRRRAEWRVPDEICGTEATRDREKQEEGCEERQAGEGDSRQFTMPAAEHQLIGALKNRCIGMLRSRKASCCELDLRHWYDSPMRS